MEKINENMENMENNNRFNDAGGLRNSLNNKPIDDEDDMVVADMSLVRKRSVFLPERIRHEGRLGGSGDGTSPYGGVDPLGRGALWSQNQNQSTYNPLSPSGGELTKEETKWAILGSLKAAVLIGSAYAIGLGAVVLLMFLAFKYFA